MIFFFTNSIVCLIIITWTNLSLYWLFSLAVYMIWISPVGKLILIWVQSSTLLIPRKPLTNWNVCAAMFRAVWSGRSIAFKNIFFKMHATLMSCVQLSERERDTSKRLPVCRIDNWLAEYQIKRSSCFSWHCHIAYNRNNTWCKIISWNFFAHVHEIYLNQFEFTLVFQSK